MIEEKSTITYNENAIQSPTPHDPKVVIDIGRGLVTMLLGLAAFLLASLGVIDFGEKQAVYSPVILLLSSLNILLAARTIDWLLDRIDAHSWAKLFGCRKQEDFDKFSVRFRKWDGSRFRMRMYGGAYFVFSLIISFVASISLYLGIDHAQGIGLLFSVSEMFGLQTKVKFLVSAVLFVYILYQMLTIESKGSRYFFVGAVSVICFLLIERILIGW
ncbi:MAG: hypothetical protein K8S18_20635 [Desulfobacula sp.]|nr:hypothetical protein [Desulfobacula sp.]